LILQLLGFLVDAVEEFFREIVDFPIKRGRILGQGNPPANKAAGEERESGEKLTHMISN